MTRPIGSNDFIPVTEMAVVDTFTKLIFGDEDYSEREIAIIEAFRLVNPDVFRDNYREMGEYLRSLGVREMIQLVSRVRQRMGESAGAPGSEADAAAWHFATRSEGRKRDRH